MAEAGPTKTILGYVSAYLKQAPRTYAEVERDHQLQSSWIETGEADVSRDFESNPGALRRIANEN